MRLKWWIGGGVVLIFLGAIPCCAQEQTQSPPAQVYNERGSASQGDALTAFFVPADFNREMFHRNKLEFSLETGCLWFNTPLILDFMIGDKFQRTPGSRNYTLVPTMFTLRWQLYDPTGPSFLRGNTDFTFGGLYTAIAQGPETLYAAGLIGLRYNFVQPNWRVVPYFEIRGGMGFTDARGPNEVRMGKPQVGQGQNFDFTFAIGAGVRYALTQRCSVSFGPEFMHISNAYLSEPGYYDKGINVFGAIAGIDISLDGLFARHSEDIAHSGAIQTAALHSLAH